MTRRDGDEFERLLALGIDESDVELHAYCLMPNHFHLLVHCPEGGLSQFMQRLGARYTRYANARFRRDGPLFKGRFWSKVVDTPEQMVNASVYIHRNADDIAFEGRLHEYRWSSLRWYADPASAPAWLSLAAVMGCFADDPQRYLGYVAQHEAA